MRRYPHSRYHHPHSGWDRPSPFPWLVFGVLALVVMSGSWWLVGILFCVLGGCMKFGAVQHIDAYYDDSEKQKRKRDAYFDDTDDARKDSPSWSGQGFRGGHMRHSRWSHHNRGHMRHGMCGPRFRYDDRDERKHKHDTYAEKPKRDTIRTADGEVFEIID